MSQPTNSAVVVST